MFIQNCVGWMFWVSNAPKLWMRHLQGWSPQRITVSQSSQYLRNFKAIIIKKKIYVAGFVRQSGVGNQLQRFQTAENSLSRTRPWRVVFLLETAFPSPTTRLLPPVRGAAAGDAPLGHLRQLEQSTLTVARWKIHYQTQLLPDHDLNSPRSTFSLKSLPCKNCKRASLIHQTCAEETCFSSTTSVRLMQRNECFCAVAFCCFFSFFILALACRRPTHHNQMAECILLRAAAKFSRTGNRITVTGTGKTWKY